MVWTEYKGPTKGGDTVSRYSSIYDLLCQYYDEITAIFFKFDHFLEMFFLNSLTSLTSGYLDEYFPNKIVDYLSVEGSYYDSERIGSPKEISSSEYARNMHSLVTFPISPKPSDVVEHVSWVRQNWMADDS